MPVSTRTTNDPFQNVVVIVAAIGLVLGASLFMTNTILADQLTLPGLFYVAFFLTFAWRRRTLAMALIYLSALFPFDLGGGAAVAVGIAEAHLALVTVLLLLDFFFKRWPIPRNPLYAPVAFYLAVCVISSINNPHGKDTYISIAQMFLYFIVTTAVFSNFVPNVKQHLRVVSAVVVGGVFLAASEAIFVLGFNSLYVFGMHKNAIGGALSYAIIICLELWFITTEPRRKGFLGIALVIIATGLFLSLSRGGWLCAMVGIGFIVTLRGQFGLLLKSLFIIIPIVAICWQFLPEDQRSYAINFNSSSQNIGDRFKSIDIASAYFERHPYIGFGVGLRKQFDATNVIFIALAETGILGLIAFALIHITFLAMVIRARLVLSPTDPRFSLVVIGAGLVFGKLVHGCVDQYWSRGSLLVVWGGAGMAIAAYYSAIRDAKANEPEPQLRGTRRTAQPPKETIAT